MHSKYIEDTVANMFEKCLLIPCYTLLLIRLFTMNFEPHGFLCVQPTFVPYRVGQLPLATWRHWPEALQIKGMDEDISRVQVYKAPRTHMWCGLHIESSLIFVLDPTTRMTTGEW